MVNIGGLLTAEQAFDIFRGWGETVRGDALTSSSQR